MTQNDIDRKVALLVEAKRLIEELRAEGLLKDSYHTIWKSTVSAAEKRMKKAKLMGDKE